MKSIVDCLTDKTSLWRYMSLKHYASLIQKRAVYHARADRFDDAFEGFLPSARVRTPGVAEDFADPAEGILPPLSRPQVLESSDPELLELAEFNRLLSYVSCWHRSGSESDAMWRLYARNKDGVAIVTTVSKLAAEVRKYEALQETLIGGFTSFTARLSNVIYVDPFATNVLEVESEDLLFYKRSAYMHEQETRLVVQHKLRLRRHEWWLPVDPRSFLDRVVVNPQAGGAQIRRVNKIGRSLGITVQRSELMSGAPDWDGVTERARESVERYWEVTAKYPGLFPRRPPGDANEE